MEYAIVGPKKSGDNLTDRNECESEACTDFCINGVKK